MLRVAILQRQAAGRAGGGEACHAGGDGVSARRSPWGRRWLWKYELGGAFKPPLGTLFFIFHPALPSPSCLLSFPRLESPLPTGDSPF